MAYSSDGGINSSLSIQGAVNPSSRSGIKGNDIPDVRSGSNLFQAQIAFSDAWKDAFQNIRDFINEEAGTIAPEDRIQIEVPSTV